MIRITRQTDYGIVLLSSLARAGTDATHTAPGLAAATHLPLPMVSKILKLLTRAGILSSQRGVKGGYQLARPPEEITVVQMISALEGPIAITACIEESDSHCEHEGCCVAQGNWQIINRALREVLSGITLAEMAGALPGNVVQLAGCPARSGGSCSG